MPEFVMPSLGADMQAGTLVAWRKAPGEAVRRGDIVAEVETEKGLIEVECFTDGVMERHLVEAGAKVPVGTPLALLRELASPGRAPEPTRREADVVPAQPSHEDAGARATPAARRLLRAHDVSSQHLHGTGSHGAVTRADVMLAMEAHHRGADAPQGEREGSSARSRLRASPLARRTAARNHLSLEGLVGSGAFGAVLARDVERAVGARPVGQREAAPDMRRAIAAVVARSKREIPHYYLSHTVDLGAMVTWLERENERRSVDARLLLGMMFVRAVALAARGNPAMNARYVDDTVQPCADVNVGMAIALRGGGLVTPAILNADRLTLDALAESFKSLVVRARAGRLSSSEMGASTISITSLGERGVESVVPVILPPQVAMVGFGAVLQRPMVVDSTVVARPTVNVSLAADHRASDGHLGSRFLHDVVHFLEEAPEP